MSDTQSSCWRWIRKGETQPNGGSWWGAGAWLDPCREDWRTERKNHCLAGLKNDWRCRYLETKYSVCGELATSYTSSFLTETSDLKIHNMGATLAPGCYTPYHILISTELSKINSNSKKRTQFCRYQDVIWCMWPGAWVPLTLQILKSKVFIKYSINEKNQELRSIYSYFL